MNYGFDVNTNYNVNLIDWAKDRQAKIEADNKVLQEQLFGGLKNAAKAGVYSKMYNEQKDAYDANMNEIYSADPSKRAELMSKYGISPKAFEEYANGRNVANAYNEQVDQRKTVDKLFQSGNGLGRIGSPMTEDEIKMYQAFGYFG